MYTNKIITDICDYIEDNLKEPLSLDLISAKAGFSPYYFSRLFTLYEGMTVMEYVRRRRLTRAADDISMGKRIIDVSLEYGFESNNGFTKAFKKVYGYPPHEYKKRCAEHRPPKPNPLVMREISDFGGMPSIRYEERPAFYIAGSVIRTSRELSSIAQMPALWNNHRLDEIENRIYASVMPKEHGEYYISFPVEGGLFRLVTCVKADDTETLDGELYVDCVPAASYAVFSPPLSGTQSDFADAIIATWKYIFDEWLPQSGHTLDPSCLDFEFYDERCHGKGPYTMDIFVPIK